MKQLFLTLALVFSGTTILNARSGLEWYTNMEEAQQKTSEANKVVLLYFTGSDWCAPCKMLKEDFWRSDRFANMASHFVLV